MRPLFLSLLLLVAPSFALLANSSRPPNIVLILADDLGYADLSCYGHPSIRTPNLDQMAREGMRFTDFYAPAPVCTPSRAGIMTGRLPIRSGMAGNPARSVAMTYSTGGLPQSEITIPEALKTNGYASACIGKWHLGHLPEFLPTHQGFDYFFGVRFANNMEPATNVHRPKMPIYSLTPQRRWWKMALLRNDEIIEPDTDPHHLTRRYTEEAIQFITRNKQKPFFLYLAHTAPHAPLFTSKHFQHHSAAGLYGDVVEELDWSVGEVLKTLRKTGLATNTFVFFTSDNGPWLTRVGGLAAPLRDGKGSTWEGGMRVPGIAWWPGTITSNVVNHELASGMDLFNTSLALAKVPAPCDRIIDGVDMSDMLLRKGPGKRNEIIYYCTGELYAIRKGPFKLHLTTANSGQPHQKHNPPLLFQLAQDPGESFNLADENPNIVADLLHEIENHHRELVPGTPQF